MRRILIEGELRFNFKVNARPGIGASRWLGGVNLWQTPKHPTMSATIVESLRSYPS